MIKDVVMDPFSWGGHEGSGASRKKAVVRQPDITETSASGFAESLNLHDALADLERRYLEQALRQARFNQRKAAAILGLRYHQFRGLYRKHAQNQAQGDAGDSDQNHVASDE